ncbi:MAG: aroB [Verrucomicrobia bacterium]|nr:aroB [Verrucomicrobiota bacterium]
MTPGLTVELGSRSYPIDFSDGLAATISQAIAEDFQKGRGAAVLTDEGVARSQPDFIAAAFAGVPCFRIAPGESSKSLATYGRVLDFLAENKLTRQGVLWVLGGGVVGDLGGFAAASYLRGIDYVQIPTTLLAMVDSSVGGKTGLNLSAGKNLVGAFHHPRAVRIAPRFLQTLPAREFAAGMAEVIKYGLLGDAALCDQLEKSPLTVRSPELAGVVRRCCEMKAAIVRADERETSPEGGRALLNLGHTFGHAIEQVTGYGTYLHGEAVAIGLAGAARLSRKLGCVAEAEVARVDRLIAAHALPGRLAAPLPAAALMGSMQHDKKVRAGRLRFVVMNPIGRAETRSDIDPQLVETVWRELGAV